jgi:kynurenine formamidase
MLLHIIYCGSMKESGIQGVRKTASQSEHLNNHSGAHIQNPKHREEDYVHGEIDCGSLRETELSLIR